MHCRLYVQGVAYIGGSLFCSNFGSCYQNYFILIKLLIELVIWYRSELFFPIYNTATSPHSKILLYSLTLARWLGATLCLLGKSPQTPLNDFCKTGCAPFRRFFENDTIPDTSTIACKAPALPRILRSWQMLRCVFCVAKRNKIPLK